MLTMNDYDTQYSNFVDHSTVTIGPTTAGTSGATTTITFPNTQYWGTNTNYILAGAVESSKIDGSSVDIDGRSLSEVLAKIEERLCILTPDPAKLEKYAALKQAYEQYKVLEALLSEETKPDAK